jgi:hypothetical protein
MDGPFFAASAAQPSSTSRTASSCSATHASAPVSPTRFVPTVRVFERSATGAGSAGPRRICRDTDCFLRASQTDCATTRYRRPSTARSKKCIPSTSTPPTKSKGPASGKAGNPSAQRFSSAKVGLGLAGNGNGKRRLLHRARSPDRRPSSACVGAAWLRSSARRRAKRARRRRAFGALRASLAAPALPSSDAAQLAFEGRAVSGSAGSRARSWSIRHSPIGARELRRGCWSGRGTPGGDQPRRVALRPPAGPLGSACRALAA